MGSFAPINEESIESVAAFMRESDKAEVLALANTDDPVHAVRTALYVPHIGTIIYGRHSPAVAVGAMWLRPHVVSVFMFATDDWKDWRVRGETAKYVRDGLFPALLAENVHRAQAPALLENTDSHKWIMRFGAVPESRLRGYGKNGEDFIMFVADRLAMQRVTGVVN